MAKNKVSNGTTTTGSPIPGTTSMVTSDIPVGGRPQKVDTERPPADVMEWNSEGTEQQPDADGQVVGAPVQHDKNPDRDARIRKLLRGEESPAEEIKTVVTDDVPDGDGDEAKEPAADDQAEAAGESEEAAAEPAEAEAQAEKPKTPPVTTESKVKARRDILANIDTERAKRRLETQLREAGEKTNAAEARAKVLEETLNSRSIIKIAKERGITRDQLMEEIVMKEAEWEAEDPAPAATAAAPEKAQPDPEKEEMKRRLAALERDKIEATDAQATAIVQSQLAPLDLPLVKASKRIAVPQDDGTVRYQTKEQVILAIAEKRWIDEGRPMHVPRVDYLGPAAETLEEALQEEHAEMLAAHTARHGKAPAAPAQDPAPAATEKKRVPALGKRMSGGAQAPVPGNGLSLDPDERRAQVKAQFGLK